MHNALSAEAETLLADGGVSGITAIEELRQHLGDTIADASAQSVAYVDLLTGDTKRHGCSPDIKRA
jgi:hypothetical protein